MTCVSTHGHLQIEVAGGWQPISTFFLADPLGMASARRPLLPQCMRVTAGTCSYTGGHLLSQGSPSAPTSHLPAPTPWPGLALARPSAAPRRRCEWPCCPHSLFPLILPPPAAHSCWWDRAVEKCGDRTPGRKGDMMCWPCWGSRCSPRHGGPAQHGVETPLHALGLVRERLAFTPDTGRSWLLVPTALPRAPPTALGWAPTSSTAPRRVPAPDPDPLRALLGVQRDGGPRRLPALRRPMGPRMNQLRSLGDQGLTPIGRGRVSLWEPAKMHSVQREDTQKWTFFLKKKKNTSFCFAALSKKQVSKRLSRQ